MNDPQSFIKYNSFIQTIYDDIDRKITAVKSSTNPKGPDGLESPSDPLGTLIKYIQDKKKQLPNYQSFFYLLYQNPSLGVVEQLKEYKLSESTLAAHHILFTNAFPSSDIKLTEKGTMEDFISYYVDTLAVLLGTTTSKNIVGLKKVIITVPWLLTLLFVEARVLASID